MEDIIRELYRVKAIRFGEFKFRNGITSPFYIDLRVVISSPQTLKKLALAYSEKLLETDFVAGVPMGGIHLATAVSLNLNRPMLLPRLGKKNHGAQKTVEGKFRPRQTVSVVEDIMTTGYSVMDTIETLESVELQISQVVCFLWYFPSRELRSKAAGAFRITTLTNIRQILEVLHSYRAITRERWFTTLSHFRGRDVSPLIKYPPLLKGIVKEKKSLLIVALDCSWERCLQLIPLLAPHVCGFKFHYDLLGQDPSFNPKTLMELSKQHNFLVVRDRKCGDVAKINRAIVGPGGENQHITIVHALPGVTSFPEGPIIVVLEMSTTDGLFTPSYLRSVLKKTSKLPNVLGYVSQYKWWPSHRLCFTPGINLTPTIEKENGQMYSSPGKKRACGTDLFIVGSAIIRQRDPLQAVNLYQKETWNPRLDSVALYGYNRFVKFSQERGLTMDEGKLRLRKRMSTTSVIPEM